MDSVALEQFLPGWGWSSRSFSSLPGQACSLWLSDTSACDVCLLLLPLHVVSSRSPEGPPCVPPPPVAAAPVPGMAMLGLQRLASLALTFHLQHDSSGRAWGR